MPHYEPCPACGFLLPDWHWEWHSQADYADIYRGLAGMECPLCGALVMYANAWPPLALPPPGSQVPRAKRQVIEAGQCARNNNNKSLDEYLMTVEGRPYASYWTGAEGQRADQQVSANP